jgi:nitrogen regulatory protein P-II 1
MKEVKAIIQPHVLGRVLDALHRLPHFAGATVSDCQGQGRGRGTGGHYEPSEETVFLAKKVKLELFCSDPTCDEVVRAIREAAHTGNPGDGVVTVADLDRVVRVRTGEEQDEAV